MTHSPLFSGLRVPCLTGLAVVLASGLSHAHPLSFGSSVSYSSSQPSGAAGSVSNWTGAAFDAANIGGSGVNVNGGTNNGVTNDSSTYVANNQPRQGQTFNTGANANGYDLSGITVRMAGYTSNTATGTNGTSWNLNAMNGPLILEVSEVGTNGTELLTISRQNFNSGTLGHPGAGQSANGAGTYITFNLPFPVHLAPNKVYAFDLMIGNGSGCFFEWLGTSTNPHAGGTAFQREWWGGPLTALSGDRVFQADMTASAAPHVPFVHPGALHTQADFDRMSAKITAGAQPWKGSFDQLGNSPFAQTWWPAYNIDVIVRGDAGNNYTRSQQDAQAIYQLSMRWKLTGNTAYADKAVEIANVWSDLSGLGGNTNVSLAAGICGYLFASGGEILSTYPGWAPAEKQAYKNMMMRVFYPANFDFLWRHHGTPESKGGNTHYRLNWDTANMASMAAIGILCDNKAVYQQAVDYFKNGTGNGRVDRAAWYVHPDGTAQTEESGRDQPHNMGGWYAMALLCQMAWNQGDDLFGYDNNRVLRAYEYNARYNLGNDVPWVFHRNASLGYTETLSGAGRGFGYPVYELVYNHYANVKGIAAPWSKQAMNLIRPEHVPGPGGHPSGQDCLALGSLTYARDSLPAASPPSGLTGHWSKNRVVLTWWGSANATSYQVQRATSVAGPYTQIGTAVEPELNFTDPNVSNTTAYHYKVVAVTPSGNIESAPLAVDRSLVTRYTFEGSLQDGVGIRHGVRKGGVSLPGYAAGQGGGQALSLNGSDQHVQLPVGTGNYRDITLATWVYWNGGNAWQRVFDFGSEIEKSMMLTVKDGSGKLAFQMTTSRGTDGTVYLAGPVMPTATWTHVAVTFNGDTATLYVNGVPVAATTGPMVAPVFSQPFCYLGRSMWNGDAYFNGRIDDFRIYNHALSGNEVYDLVSPSSNRAPTFTGDPLRPAGATEDAAYNPGTGLSAFAADPDGGTLTYTKVTGPDWLTVSSNGTLSGTPANGDVGNNLFVVRVTDPAGATDDANLHITVANTNDAPVWLTDSLVKPSVTRDQPYLAVSLAGNAADDDAGATLAFSKSAGPAWLSVAADGSLSGTPAVADLGNNVFTVRVTDAVGAFDEAVLNVTVLPFQMRSHYAFEDNTDDSLGNFPGTASGGPVYGTGRIGRGMVFDGGDDFVSLPAAVADSQDISIATWVFWKGGAGNQRIFDFGNNTSQYLFLSPDSGGLRFEIKNGGGEQQVGTTVLATGQWVHVTLTLGGTTATLYVNGVAVGANNAVTINPGDFKPQFNYIGKSQWPDPLFNGLIDGFRIYNHAITPADIAVLMDEIPAVPTGVTATPKTGRIDLSWSAAQGAQSYTVKRSLTAGGPYTTIASGLAATTYSNTGVTNGTRYYYVVSATDAKGESPDSDEATAVPSDLLAWLKLDETTGTTAQDSSGNGWNGTLTNGPVWAPGLYNGGLSIPATNNESVTLPSGIVSGLNDFTISGWVKVSTFGTFARIFDFGTGTNNYMFLTPQYTATAPNAAKFRFAIRTPSMGEQLLTSSIAVTAGTWTHYAVTLSGSTGRLYINGQLAASNTGMTLKPSSLGNTTLNWLGDSQFAPDPTLNGQLDDFRIHSRALTGPEILAAANPSPGVPVGLTIGAGDTKLPLTWSPADFASSYTVKRSTVSGGPYEVVATGLAGTTHNDTGLTNDATYFYVVSATNTQGSSADSAEASGTPTYLRLHLKFDETTGTAASDSSGLGWHATTVNGPVWEAGKQGNALAFTGSSSQHATLPTGVIGGLTNATFMTWVKLNGAPTTWQRIFDFGTGNNNYLFLTTQYVAGANANRLRFGIRTAAVAEQLINSTTTTPLGTWTHVAVVLSGSTGRIYLNGNLVGENTAMTLNPSSLGATTLNYLGRSQWPDPYFNGSLDDFRIYSRAMTAGEVGAYANPLEAPGNLIATGGFQQAELGWSPVPNASGYTVKSSTVPGGPYTAIASGITSPGFLHTGLTPGVARYYVISAVNVTGESANSVEAVVVPDSPPITEEEISKSRLELGAGSGDGMSLSLSVELSVPGHFYQLQRSSSLAEGSWQEVGDALPGNGGILQQVVPIPVPGEKEFYRILISR